MGLPIGVAVGHADKQDENAQRDVSDRQRLERELATAQARFDALCEATGQLAFRADRHGRNIASSPAWVAYTGRPAEVAADEGWLDLVHPDDRPGARTTLDHLLEHPRIVQTECRFRGARGAYRRFAVRIVPVRDGDGAVVEFVGAAVDIEEQHRKELERHELSRALERKRDKLEAILEALPVGVVLTEVPSGRVLQTNRAFDTLGENAAPAPLELAARPWGSTGPGPIARAIREGEPVEGVEARQIRDDGTERWLRMSAVPLRDGSGAVVAGLGTTIDITDRKRMEEALRDSERRLRFCLESIPQQVWIAAADGSLEYYSPRWYEYTGLEPGQADGWGWSMVVHPDDRSTCFAAWKRAVRTGAAYEVEVRLRAADGSYRWFLGRALPQRDEDGRILRWFGSNTDMHEHKQIREALEASEARFRRIFELDLLGMCTWRMDGQILDANREYLRTFGYDEADLRAGRINWYALTPPDQAQLGADTADELQRSGVIRPTEKVCLRKDGSRVPVILTAALDAVGGETGTAFLFDASDRKQLEEFQHQLIGVVSHDLRSPLAAMLTTAGVLLRSASLSPSERRGLERIHGTAERMRRITRDLLDYTQARVGRGLSLTASDADIGAICRAAAAEAQLLAPDRTVICSGEGAGELRCDPGRIEQALSNLLANAVKYGEGRIALRWSSSEDEFAIEVENEGRPIDGALLPQLFLPFRQGPRPDAPVTQSLGLGLFIVREIARAHGGDASIRPLPHGTLVRLTLARRLGNACDQRPEASSSARW